MMTQTCIGEPISWLRLETFALDARDPAITEHVAACPACRTCLDEITQDVVALPVLHVKPRRRWWTLAWPAFAAVAAAAIVLFLLRPRTAVEEGMTTIKGVGDVVIDVVRERAGTVRDDVRSFSVGDRWKVVITCPLQKSAWVDVGVVEADAKSADFPLAPVRVTCGNRVIIPGAFTLTSDKPHRVCVRLATGAAPARTLPNPGDEGVACLTLRPE